LDISSKKIVFYHRSGFIIPFVGLRPGEVTTAKESEAAILHENMAMQLDTGCGHCSRTKPEGGYETTSINLKEFFYVINKRRKGHR
jgi:hypothetical protein